MPKYKKKITRLMKYDELKEAMEDQPIDRRAFLSVLFFAGCRVSEALALSADDITYTPDTVFIQFFRLKGSKQTDPTELPRADALEWLCHQKDTTIKVFCFGRSTAYRIVKKVFPTLYPHYFRMNRITNTLERFGVSTVKHSFGLSLTSIEHYIGKVDIKRVGISLREEIGKA